MSNMVARRDPTGLRLSRIQQIHRMLMGVGEVDLTRFLASCEYSMGLTRKRVRVYLQTLVDLGYIEVDDEGGTIKEVMRESLVHVEEE